MRFGDAVPFYCSASTLDFVSKRLELARNVLPHRYLLDVAEELEPRCYVPLVVEANTGADRRQRIAARKRSQAARDGPRSQSRSAEVR